jgi:hypothetical protein
MEALANLKDEELLARMPEALEHLIEAMIAKLSELPE